MKVEIDVPEKMLKYIKNNSLSNEDCIMLLYPLLHNKKIWIDEIAKLLNIQQLDIIKFLDKNDMEYETRLVKDDLKNELKNAEMFVKRG